MKIKAILTGILLLFVGLSVIYLVVGEFQSSQTTEGSSIQPSLATASDKNTADDSFEAREGPGQQRTTIIAAAPNAGDDSQPSKPIRKEQPTATPDATAGQYDQGVEEAGKDSLAMEPVEVGGRDPQKVESGQKENPGPNEPEHTVIAYYFHGTQRCVTCRTIEAYTEEALKAGFSEQLSAGLLKWQPVNVDASGKGHFVTDYQLTTRSVVLVDMRDGRQKRWKNLMRIWQLVRDKQAFTSYIQEETRKYLAGNYE